MRQFGILINIKYYLKKLVGPYNARGRVIDVFTLFRGHVWGLSVAK
jgi:hypothetical protein